MEKYELNGLGKDWIFEAENEEEATLKYLEDISVESIEQYEYYCEVVNVDPKIEWKKVI